MADAKIIDVNEVIERQRLGRFQIMLGGLLLVAMFVDGFEAQAPGFAAPAIIKEWGIPRSAMGLVFGAGNLGLMVGAVLLGILGDHFGRKRTIVVGCLVDIFSAIVVLAPLIAPMGAAFGVDPIHQGVIFLANLELGFLTPPVGLNLYLSSSRFGKPLPEVTRTAFPFLVIMAVAVLLITYVPDMSLGILKLLGRYEPAGAAVP